MRPYIRQSDYARDISSHARQHSHQESHQVKGFNLINLMYDITSTLHRADSCYCGVARGVYRERQPPLTII
jgi:hypothetical protein